jgi:hypothetical protein
MNEPVDLQALLTRARGRSNGRLALFALINLGLLDSLADGLLSPEQAVRVFYNYQNCLFVRQRVRGRAASEIMGRGVQLPDLFEALPTGEARREFQRELNRMRALCLGILRQKRRVA